MNIVTDGIHDKVQQPFFSYPTSSFPRRLLSSNIYSTFARGLDPTIELSFNKTGKRLEYLLGIGYKNFSINLSVRLLDKLLPQLDSMTCVLRWKC